MSCQICGALDDLFTVLMACTLVIYMLCQLTLLHVLVRASISAARPVKEDHLRAGMALAARGEARAAEKELRRVLAIDPSDVEAHLNMATLLARGGDVRRARRHLKWCRRFDIDGKWDWEVDEQLESLANSGNGRAVPDREE